MDDRLLTVVAVVVGVALVATGLVRYLGPGYPPPPMEPFTTGIFVTAAGALLAGVAVYALYDPPGGRAVEATTLVGVVTLGLATVRPGALEFGGVFWLGMVALAAVAAGAYLSVRDDGGLNTEPP